MTPGWSTKTLSATRFRRKERMKKKLYKIVIKIKKILKIKKQKAIKKIERKKGATKPKNKSTNDDKC